MKNPALTLRVICFGIFEFSPQTGELRRHGLKVKLEPQASKILSLLLEYPGKICTRQELQQHLWQDNTLVDFERSLYKGIHTLRGTLGDSATAPRCSATVTGRGYRFIPIPQEPSNHGGRRRNGGKVGSVAVLPFASESADAEMELLNRRIVERVIDTISRTPGVRVLAYNTVQHHRGKDLDFRRLGENLLVDAIAAGEMIRHNDELLLHVKLIDVSNGSQLWGEQFKEHYSDVLEEPETLAGKICDRLRPILVRTANSRRNERSRHTQRNQAGGAFRVCDGTNNKVTASSQSGLESAQVFSGRSGNERGSSRTLIIYMLSSGTSKFRRNPRASQALTAPRGKMPGSRAPTCVRSAIATSRPVPQGKLDTVHIPNLS